ncbi:hypothetical protein SFB1_137G3 [Candidatus Arthromitus sp. SFB-1]|nr:hypothetical protein SFB1_137G3 [Candidatus Arthromitus sp. SFB-1]
MGIDFSKINKRYIGSLIIIPIIISLILGGMFLKNCDVYYYHLIFN